MQAIKLKKNIESSRKLYKELGKFDPKEIEKIERSALKVVLKKFPQYKKFNIEDMSMGYNDEIEAVSDYDMKGVDVKKIEKTFRDEIIKQLDKME